MGRGCYGASVELVAVSSQFAQRFYGRAELPVFCWPASKVDAWFNGTEDRRQKRCATSSLGPGTQILRGALRLLDTQPTADGSSSTARRAGFAAGCVADLPPVPRSRAVAQFGSAPDWGQVVAGSNPVSPTYVSQVDTALPAVSGYCR